MNRRPTPSREAVLSELDRIASSYATNRRPAAEPRLLFPGWGPKFWE